MMAVVNNVDKKEQRVKNVLKVIMKQNDNKTDMWWAQHFAHTAIRMSGDDLLMQIPYVLMNLRYWRGEEAQRCKKVLKEYGGVR
ncbi:hypothetical protein LCGC14_0611060 [marine sediment metagenome]|uniref:Uncharacterized protein n=1 Tax=marine sediment metagenome TaxID=412755 RepID=A0A0F9RC87_9ZZZZ